MGVTTKDTTAYISGYFVNSATIPSYLVWVRYLSWINFGLEGLVVTGPTFLNYLSFKGLGVL